LKRRGFFVDCRRDWVQKMHKIQIKKLDFLENSSYIINSIPTAPLLKSMRNPVGFCFYRGFVV